MSTFSDRISSIHGAGNAAEAVLWWFLATLLGIATLRSTRHRLEYSLGSMAFLVFGATDVIEISTGAWWRPWWLLVTKGICVALFCVLWYRHSRRARA